MAFHLNIHLLTKCFLLATDHHDTGRNENEEGVSRLLNRKGKQFHPYWSALVANTYLLPGLPVENENVVASISSPATAIDSTCVTNQGKRGNCESFEECFPLLNLPEDKFGNGTANYNNLNDDVYEMSVDRKCASIVHAGTDEYESTIETSRYIK